MRIVAGRFRGRPLVAPRHEGTRPTSDRVREAVFNILAHGLPEFSLEGARVLDLFAGTGALGLEALSRGAAFCLFVEESAEARGLIRRNVEALALEGATRIFRRDATALGPAGGMAPFGLAFLDPPYGRGLAEQALAAALAGGWLAPGAIVVAEEEAGAPVALPPGFVQLDARVYGDTQVMFGQAV
jgi:16S rRNA (guanine966-N2)-methyltransferase